MIDIPKDAQWNWDGLYYKKGRFGFMYIWNFNQWMRAHVNELEFNRLRKAKIR